MKIVCVNVDEVTTCTHMIIGSANYDYEFLLLIPQDNFNCAVTVQGKVVEYGKNKVEDFIDKV